MDAELVVIGIVDAAGTDGYSLIYEYSDGSQSSPQGWYGSVEEAEQAVTPPSDYADMYVNAPVEDWTSD